MHVALRGLREGAKKVSRNRVAYRGTGGQGLMGCPGVVPIIASLAGHRRRRVIAYNIWQTGFWQLSELVDLCQRLVVEPDVVLIVSINQRALLRWDLWEVGGIRNSVSGNMTSSAREIGFGSGLGGALTRRFVGVRGTAGFAALSIFSVDWVVFGDGCCAAF